MSSQDPFSASLHNAHTPGMSITSQASFSTHPYPDGYFQPVERIHLGRALAAPFQSTNWLMNWIWMSLCVLLTMFVVGGPQMYGYMAEVAEKRVGGRDRNWPDFDSNRLVEYLLRGLWAYLWSLIWSFPIVLACAIPIGITLWVCRQLSDNNQELPNILMGIAGGVLSALVMLVGMMVVSISMAHASLSNDFLKGADLPRIIFFIRRVFWTSTYVALVYMFASIVLTSLGALACFIGMVPGYAYLMLFATDLVAQLYDIFVNRGGVPIVSLESDTIIDAQVI